MSVQPNFSFTRAPLSEVSPALRKELGEKIANKHRLEGAWTRDVTGHPVIAMSLDSITDSALRSKILRLLRRGGFPDFRVVGFMSEYITRFGHIGTFIVAIATDRYRKMTFVARFCAPIQPVWVELFESSWSPEVILFHNQQPIERLKASTLLGSQGFPRLSSFVLDDDFAAYWDVLNTDSNGWGLTLEDRLRIGWVQCLKARCQILIRQIQQFVTMDREHLPLLPPERAIPAISRILKELEWIRENSNGRLTFEEYTFVLAEKHALDRLLDTVDEVIKQHGLLRVFLDFDEIHAVHPHLSDEWFSPVWWATFVYTTLPTHTNCGLRLAYLNPDRSDSTDGNLRYHDIDAKGIASTIAPEEWWPRIAQPINLSHVREGYVYLAADAVPADPTSVYEALKKQIVVQDPQGCLKTTWELLTEARTCQEWTIPPGAVVELQWGPFTRLQFWYLHGSDWIRVIAWTKEGEFWFAGFNIESCTWDEVCSGRDLSECRDIEAAWCLLLAAIVRDFMVVEQRERVWHARQQYRPRGIRPIDGRGDKIVVYIPRVRYLNKAPEPAVILQGTHELDLKRRSQHAVRAHLRKVSRDASEAQRVLAMKYDFILPEGYTFVRPHMRMRGGLDNRERVYRSRSALACFYHAEMIEDVGHKVEWFQFERDCKRFLEMRGLTVEHVAASQAGDYGIDLYASTAEASQLYAVQCKCYNPRHLVGPAVIRELVGSLTRYPKGTIGMLITTSDLTRGAQEEAERNSILWINGATFVHEMQQTQLNGPA